MSRLSASASVPFFQVPDVAKMESPGQILLAPPLAARKTNEKRPTLKFTVFLQAGRCPFTALAVPNVPNQPFCVQKGENLSI